MIRTQILRCTLPKATADALNQESGRIHTAVLVEHYRVFQHSGHWLSGLMSPIEMPGPGMNQPIGTPGMYQPTGMPSMYQPTGTPGMYGSGSPMPYRTPQPGGGSGHMP